MSAAENRAGNPLPACGKLGGMRKPSLRVTKWLGDVPVEGECTSCADAKFKITPATPRPTREEYAKTLQQEFDRHFKYVHMREDASQAAARIVREATEDKN